MQPKVRSGRQPDFTIVANAAELLKLIGNPNRLAILCRLSDSEASVSEMESELGIRQPTLSQQLGELRKAGLIDDRREGKVIFYRFVEEQARSVVDYVRDLFIGEGTLPARSEARATRLVAAPSAAPSFHASVFARILENGLPVN